MNEEVKNPLPNYFTVRFTNEEVDFINQNLDLLRGENINMSRNKILFEAIKRGIEMSKPVEIVKDNPEILEEIEKLKKLNANLAEQNQSLVERINELIEEKENKKGIIVEMRPEFEDYFTGILEICKRDGYANTFGELVEKMLMIFHKRGEFILSKQDIEYLNQLKQSNHD